MLDMPNRDVPFRPLGSHAPAVEVERRADGTLILSCPYELGEYERSVIAYLRRWAIATPSRTFIAQRLAGGWQECSYGEMRAMADAIGQALLERGLNATRPVMILSGNSIAHAALMLGALTVGVPVAPVSPAYSLAADHTKLRFVAGLAEPGLVFVEQAGPFERALDALDLDGVEIVAVSGTLPGHRVTPFAELVGTRPGPAVEDAYAGVGPDTVAKILFTSGSTGQPKGVINTQRMLCATQRMNEVLWFEEDREPPVALDWMPWNHTMAGNGGFNRIMRQGGSLYIDNGRPLPGEYHHTIANLREVSPTAYGTAPAAFAMLADALEKDEELCRAFFKRLAHLGYGGASLPEAIWQRFQTLAVKATGMRIPVLCGWGSTETGPGGTALYWAIEGSGNIGLPLPGIEIKMLPLGDGRHELRIRGPNVMPGYLKRPDLTAAAFDEEGFYKIGDTGTFIDPEKPVTGLRFAGRVAEDFKLLTATWVATGPLRLAILEAASPLLRDVVVTGQDRDFVGLLAWPNLAACQDLLGADGAAYSPADIVRDPRIVEAVRAALRRHNAAHPASSTRIPRAILMAEPPSFERNEITDKGYVNQAATLAHRAALVEKLYAADPEEQVIRV